MRNKILVLTIFFLIPVINIRAQVTSKFTDTRNGKVYKKVLIGKQIWMAENLNVHTFRNGDVIPEVKDQDEWNKAGKDEQPAWCYYNNDTAMGNKFGVLYNWFAVNDARGLAPQGFHIPSNREWNSLDSTLNSDILLSVFGSNNTGEKMKTKTGWKENGNGTNSSGFSALPAGARMPDTFQNIGENGCWWSSTATDFVNDEAHEIEKRATGAIILHEAKNFYSPALPRGFGFAVRCIKD